MGSTVDGLVSGLSTSSMITQLMSIEAAPQTRLKTKVSNAQTVVTAYQSVNSKLAALKTAADDLSQLSTWRSVKPASSSASVTTAADPAVVNPATGSVTFDVVQLARAQVSTARVPSTGDVTSSGTLNITVGSGEPVVIDISADRSAQGISDAINNAGLGVRASVVQTSTGDSVLQMTSAKAGVGNGFTVDGLDFDLMTAVAAQDAQIQVGGADSEGGYSVTSSTNTFSNLISGVTITATKAESGVTVDVGANATGIADKIKAMVDAANAVLAEVTAQTRYDAGSGKGSTLTGDFMVRQIATSVLGAISQGQADLGSLSKMGVQLDGTGKLSFNAETFTAAYAADPAKIQAAGITMADSFEALAKKQTDNVTAAITGRKSLIDAFTVQIDDWDLRLATRRTSLEKTYSALETSLSKLKSQSSYLSSQLG